MLNSNTWYMFDPNLDIPSHYANAKIKAIIEKCGGLFRPITFGCDNAIIAIECSNGKIINQSVAQSEFGYPTGTNFIIFADEYHKFIQMGQVVKAEPMADPHPKSDFEIVGQLSINKLLTCEQDRLDLIDLLNKVKIK